MAFIPELTSETSDASSCSATPSHVLGLRPGHRCCSELHEGCRSTSPQGSTPWVALDLMGY
eukprot:9630980-Alexandrium_andersonii.AAC.1